MRHGEGGAFGPEAARIVIALADHAPAGVEVTVFASDELQRTGEVVARAFEVVGITGVASQGNKDMGIDGRKDGHLGLGYDCALEAVDRSAWSPDRLQRLINAGSSGSLFSADADPFFRAQRIEASAVLTPGYSVLVVLDGTGSLRTHKGPAMELAPVDTVLLPFAAGETRLGGKFAAIRCLPPAAIE